MCVTPDEEGEIYTQEVFPSLLTYVRVEMHTYIGQITLFLSFKTHFLILSSKHVGAGVKYQTFNLSFKLLPAP